MPRKRPQCRRTSRFPRLLHSVLQDALSDPTLAAIISWDPSGTAFKIHDQRLFVNKVIPRYFPKMKSYKSFRRQLNLYGLKVQSPSCTIAPTRRSTTTTSTTSPNNSCPPPTDHGNYSPCPKTIQAIPFQSKEGNWLMLFVTWICVLIQRWLTSLDTPTVPCFTVFGRHGQTAGTIVWYL